MITICTCVSVYGNWFLHLINVHFIYLPVYRSIKRHVITAVKHIPTWSSQNELISLYLFVLEAQASNWRPYLKIFTEIAWNEVTSHAKLIKKTIWRASRGEIEWKHITGHPPTKTDATRGIQSTELLERTQDGADDNETRRQTIISALPFFR